MFPSRRQALSPFLQLAGGRAEAFFLRACLPAQFLQIKAIIKESRGPLDDAEPVDPEVEGQGGNFPDPHKVGEKWTEYVV